MMALWSWYLGVYLYVVRVISESWLLFVPTCLHTLAWMTWQVTHVEHFKQNFEDFALSHSLLIFKMVKQILDKSQSSILFSRFPFFYTCQVLKSKHLGNLICDPSARAYIQTSKKWGTFSPFEALKRQGQGRNTSSEGAAAGLDEYEKALLRELVGSNVETSWDDIIGLQEAGMFAPTGNAWRVQRSWKLNISWYFHVKSVCSMIICSWRALGMTAFGFDSVLALVRPLLRREFSRSKLWLFE